ncbi:MAG: hypothetical protein KA354_05915 [Phycisphaerae bacterium]|nr:hypothetical protein [Phycisphaerae bacterium]
MDKTVNTAVVSTGPLKFLEKVRIVAAAGVAVVLMTTIGWMAASPVDPDMAVSYTTGGRAIWTVWPAMLALTVVASLLGTVIAGPRLPESGLLAASVGLVALAIRGGSMQAVLGYHAGTEEATRKALMVNMEIDALLWAVILVGSWKAVSMVWCWLWVEQQAEVAGSSGVPLAKDPKRAPGAANGGRSRAAWAGWAVTAVLGLFIIWVTIARTPVATVARGQVIASVAGGLFLAAMAARYFTGVDDVRGYLLAPLIVALVGYLLGYLQADMSWTREGSGAYALLATTPPHALARPLPLEYVAGGLVGSIVGYWSGGKVELVAEQEL